MATPCEAMDARATVRGSSRLSQSVAAARLVAGALRRISTTGYVDYATERVQSRHVPQLSAFHLFRALL